MRTKSICLVIASVLFCPSASAQWVQTSLESCPVEALAVRGTDLLAGSSGVLPGTAGIFLSTNRGSSWTRLNLELDETLLVCCFAFIGSNLFAGTRSSMGFGSGIFLSTNSGTNWTAINTGLTDTSVFCLAPCGTSLFAGTYEGVFLSTNDGTSWSAVDTGLPDSAGYIAALAGSGTNIFAGTQYGGIFLTTNNGMSWSAVNEGLPPNGRDVCVIQTLAVHEMGLLVGTQYDGVFLSTNNGTSWTAARTGLPRDNLSYTSYEGIDCIATSGANFFAGTNGKGVFLSTNSGTSWTEVNTGLTNTYVMSLTISGADIFTGTRNGVWTRPLSEMITLVEPSSGTPSHFSLEQNYPNPFNPSTTIRFELPKASDIRLSVYDILGREVIVLANERKAAGVHEVRLDGSGLASGMYLCRLRAGDFTATRRLLLLK
jgi:photosystem II stability/assembly factor-like uncharacterized protein